MLLNAASPALTLAVVGTGAMGRGIAQIAALAGLKVWLHDSAPGAADQALLALSQTLNTLRDKGKIAPEAAAQAIEALRVAPSLDVLADAHVAVEAIVEDLGAKQTLFRQLEAVLAPEAVLATNTSSLSVTAIAAACRHPDRVAGFHFFNPVPLMKVVEVIAGLRSDPAVLRFLDGLARRMGHTPVQAQDTPGFIVNHAGRGYGTEALRLLSETVGSPQAIDDVLRGQAGFRLGPFELFDLTGLDVSAPVMESIYRQYFDEPRYRPSPITVQRHVAGLLGRKSGEGFYRYADGKIQRTDYGTRPARQPSAVWICRAEPDLALRARDLVQAAGATLDTGALPSPASLCIVTPVGEDVTHCAVDEGIDPGRTVGLDLLFPQDRCAAVYANPRTTPEALAEALGLLAPVTQSVRVLRDSTGLVTQRVIATIVNIASDIAQQGIATPADIDQAVTLGLGYPQGPLTWGDALGPARIVRILRGIEALSGDPRYRSSPWLRRRAELGLSLRAGELQPD
jgi:3-hydroxybutyryl-CoA dehydrogenase